MGYIGAHQSSVHGFVGAFFRLPAVFIELDARSVQRLFASLQWLNLNGRETFDWCMVVGERNKHAIVVGVYRKIALRSAGVVEIVQNANMLFVQHRDGIHFLSAVFFYQFQKQVLL